jgi:hypothetical protein
MFYWEGRFDQASQNPPFVKLCMTLPVRAIGLRMDKAWLLRGSPSTVINSWFLLHGERVHLGFLLARLVSVVFYAVGAVVIGSWAGHLFGPWARRAAMALWCFNPLVLSHAMMAMVDVGAAVMGVAAARAFVSLLGRPGWPRTLRAGTLLGLALCSKFTLLVLPGVFLCLALFRLLSPEPGLRWRVRMLCLVLSVLALAVPVIGICYGFQGMNVPLAERSFGSNAFRSLQGWAASHRLGAVVDAIVRGIPLDYLGGLDFQWTHTEGGIPNYFHGRLSAGGFWYYYLAALGMRMPLGLWCIALLAGYRAARGAVGPRSDEECLLLAPLVLFLVCQVNTTVTYLRYLMPVVPFVCISLARVAAAALGPHAAAVGATASPAAPGFGSPLGHSPTSGRPVARWYAWLAAALVAATVGSPLVRHPHYLGYFNELVGGVHNGWRYFGPSEHDMGQDARRLADWQRRHPEARPMRVAIFSAFALVYLGIREDGVTSSNGLTWFTDARSLKIEPRVGYLAISVGVLNELAASATDFSQPHNPSHDFCRWLRDRPPREMVSTTIFVYRLSEQDIEAFHRWQQEQAGLQGCPAHFQ